MVSKLFYKYVNESLYVENWDTILDYSCLPDV